MLTFTRGFCLFQSNCHFFGHPHNVPEGMVKYCSIQCNTPIISLVIFSPLKPLKTLFFLVKWNFQPGDFQLCQAGFNGMLIFGIQRVIGGDWNHGIFVSGDSYKLFLEHIL